MNVGTPEPAAPSGRPAAPWTAYLVAVAAGLMATTAMPPFRGLGLLIVPALALLFGLMLRDEHPARSAWVFGVAHQASLLHWLFLLGDEAPIASRTLVPAMALGAILYASLFYLLFGWAWGRVRGRLGAPTTLMLTPVLWTLMEALRGAGEMGFPWCLSGAAALGTPWAHLMSAAGEIALGAWVAGAAAVIVAWIGPGRAVLPSRARLMASALVGAGAGALVAGAAIGRVGTATPTVDVAAVQADVALEDKWVAARIDSTTVPYARLTREAAALGADLIVWAETAVPGNMTVNRALRQWVLGQVRRNGTPVFVGHPQYDFGGEDGARRKFNGATLYAGDGKVLGRYDKHHLLPFGERMPFQWLVPALGEMDLGQAEWMVGARPAAIPLEADGREASFAALICYEAIFPGLARDGVRDGARFLVNITNDGWFGFTAGPVQHAEMARARAAECGVPLVRCANNGVSFIVDARGRTLAEAGFGERTVVTAPVPVRAGETAFVRFGSWPLVLGLLLWTVLTVRCARGRGDG